jgi:hypothetical protein
VSSRSLRTRGKSWKDGKRPKAFTVSAPGELALQRLGAEAPTRGASAGRSLVAPYFAYGFRDLAAGLVVGLTLHAGLLYFVLSTWLHRRARAYLDPPKP